MGSGPHPYEQGQSARRVVASVALAHTGDPALAAGRMVALGLVSDPERAEAPLRHLEAHLRAARDPTLNNVYLHVTFACQSRCAHCYADAGEPRGGELSVEAVERAGREAAAIGFRQVVVTGGEPLAHQRRDELIEVLSRLRIEAKPLIVMLRTSLALEMSDALVAAVAQCADKVVVSIDGDEPTHDERRGLGSYARVVGNLRRLAAAGGDADITLAAVLPARLVAGPPGQSVRRLAHELGLGAVRFKPLLPLGRAGLDAAHIVPEAPWGHLDPVEAATHGFAPTTTCGFGHNLYVEPDGAAYPCYAWHAPQWRLGSLHDAGGVCGIVQGTLFARLAPHTVDSNRRCRACDLRFLCGGACRAWNRQPPEGQLDLDEPALDCGPLHARARSLLGGALAHLGIDRAHWLAAGLPLPDCPPAADRPT